MDEPRPNPTVIVLAGINGAGKTTASRSLLANTLKVLTFVNDRIEGTFRVVFSKNNP